MKAEQDIPTPTPDPVIGIALSAAGWQKTELSRSGERIVACDMAEPAEERRALVDGGTRELAERVLGSWARQELSAADRQGPELQQPLVIFGQSAYVVGQELDRAGVFVQTFSGGSHARVAEHGRVEEKVTNDGSRVGIATASSAFLAVGRTKA